MPKTTAIYEKICDIICRVSRGDIQLRFNVVLNRKDMKGRIKNGIQHYEYESNKYTNVRYVRTINRDLSYYLTLHLPKNRDSTVMIKAENMMLLKKGLDHAVSWFQSSKYVDLFSIKNDLLIVNKNLPNIKVDIPVGYGDLITLEPAVIKDGDSVTMGVMLTINNKLYFSLTIENLYELHYHLYDFNMYQSAITVLNSLPPIDFENVEVTRFGGNTINHPSGMTEQNSYVKSNRTGYKKPKNINDIF